MADERTVVIKDVTLRIYDAVPPGVLFDIAEATDNATGNEAIDALRYFSAYAKAIRAMVVDEDQEALRELLYRKQDPPTFDDINEALGGLVARATGRPSERPSGSPSGSGESGAPSKRVSFSRRTVEMAEASSKDGTAAAS